ncbi:hypothetical protein BKA83DRAFT_4188321 [Pisolithus microcarpus]|nr:hypothetical protein BKA83DRAFT_4188321 [Pisolithus microcarpus]
METQTPRPTSNSSNPASQGSPRTRGLSNLRAKEAGSASRGIGRERAGRGNRGGRGGGRQRGNLTGRVRTDNPSSRLSQCDTVSSTTETSSNSLASPSIPRVADKLPDRNSVTGKAQSRRLSRVVSAPEVSPITPSGSPRLSNRRRRSHQQGKASSKSSKSRNSSTLSPLLPRKDFRHDIEALVERVRAVAMAENRPTTPGSHIDWAGDEDDSLPDLDDWGVTTTHIMADEERDEGISPILGDTLKQLPEPHSDAGHHDKQEGQACDTLPSKPRAPSFHPAPVLHMLRLHRTYAEKDTSESNVDLPPEPLGSGAKEHFVPKDAGVSESILPREQLSRSSSGERVVLLNLPRPSRSGASSPLGNNVCTHSRQKAHHTSRPVITGEAISKLARTIGSGLGPVPRNQGIPVSKGSTVAS